MGLMGFIEDDYMHTSCKAQTMGYIGEGYNWRTAAVRFCWKSVLPICVFLHSVRSFSSLLIEYLNQLFEFRLTFNLRHCRLKICASDPY